MPIKYNMSWQADRCRWRKMFKSKWYFVTPKELGCLPTKEASWSKANQWWESQMAGISNKTSLSSLLTEALQEMVGSKPPLQRIESLVRKGEAARKLQAIVDFISRGLPSVEGTNCDPLEELDLFNKNPALTNKAVEFVIESSRDNKKSKNWKNELTECVSFPSSTIEEQELFVSEAVNKLIKGDPTDLDPNLENQFKKWRQLQLNSGKNPARIKMNIVMAGYLSAFLNGKTLKDIDETFWEEFYFKVGSFSWKPSYKSRVLNTAKIFLNYLYEKRLIELPRNINSKELKFNVPKKEIKTIPKEHIKQLINKATGQTKLHILLMLNCGMNTQDINDLKDSEVNWVNGTITRKRSKTKNNDSVPTVTYQLWEETFNILKAHRSHKETVLLTKTGKPWIQRSISESEYKNSNSITSNFRNLCDKLKLKTSPKQLRTTSASSLAKNDTFKFYIQYFLGQSPKGVTDSHYVVPNQEEFFRALDWLRKELLN